MVSAGNECIRWAQDGTSFWIGAPDALESPVLPRFFKHNRMAFFVKQQGVRLHATRGAHTRLDVAKEWFHARTCPAARAQFHLAARDPLPPTPPSPSLCRRAPSTAAASSPWSTSSGTSAPSRSLAANTAGSATAARAPRRPPSRVAAGDDGDAAAVAALPGGSSSSGLSGSGGVSGSVMSGSGGSGSGSGKRKISERRRPRLVERLVGGHDGSSGRTSSGRNSSGSQLRRETHQLRGAVGESERVERPWPRRMATRTRTRRRRGARRRRARSPTSRS